MKISDLIEFYENVGKSNSLQDFKSNFDNIDEVGEYMNQMAQNGKVIVLEKISEKKFVQAVNVIRSFLLSSMLVSGVGSSLAVAEISGDLKPYTDTVALTILGILADEEVI